MGKVHSGLTKQEKDSRKFRRSIYAVKDIDVGVMITAENIKCIRPGFGLTPKIYEFLLDKKAKGKIESGSPLSLDLFF